MSARPGRLHHVELWVPDLPRAIAEWGGPGHYAAYLTSTDAYEVELVATTPAESPS